MSLVTKIQNFSSKTEIFNHLLNTIFKFFHFSDTFFLDSFFLTKNVVPCDKDVNKNSWSILICYIFSDIKESSYGCSMNLGDDRPNHCRRWRLGGKPSIVPTKFITGDEGGRGCSSPRWEASLTWFLIIYSLFLTVLTPWVFVFLHVSNFRG